MNKPLGFPFGFFTNDNTPDSGKYFNRTATPIRPYLDVAEAMSVLPLGVRVAGLPINIAGVEYHWKPEWTTEALLNQAPVIKLPNIDETYLPRLSKSPVSSYSDTGIVLSPRGAVYGEAYSYASGTKVVGVLRIKLPIAYSNCIMKIEGSINRLGPTELVKFKIGGYWSGGGAFAGGGYKNWWSIDSATWERSLSDLSDVPLRFGYELTDPNDTASVKHAVIYIGTLSTDWGVQAGFFIDKVYCINSALTVDNTKDWEVNVIDDDSAIIANQSTVFLVPAQPISFVDKVLSGCELTFSDSDTKVSVGTGYYDIAGTQYNPVAMGTPFNIPTPHASLPRIDIITGTQNLISVADSNFKYYVGTPSESAVAPTVPAGEVLIREILVSVAGVQPSAPDLSGFVTTNTEQEVRGLKIFTQPITAKNTTIRTNRRFEFFKPEVDPSLPFPTSNPNFGGGVNQVGNEDFSFIRYAGSLSQAVLDVFSIGFLSRILDFKVRPTINGSNIALVSEVDLKLDISAYNDRFKGKYTTLANLQTAFPTANAGDYAQVDAGAGVDAINYNYDTEEGWIQGGSGSGATDTDQLLEGATNLYYTESRVAANSAVAANTDKRSYPSGDETKLLGIATGATANVKATSAETITGTDDAKFTTAKTIFDWWANIKNSINRFTKTQSFVRTTLADATIIDWDLNLNQVAQVTLGANRTLANPTNITDGATYILILKQDATGSRTLIFGSNYKFNGGAPLLSTVANAVDIITFVSDGNNLYGCIAKNFI